MHETLRKPVEARWAGCRRALLGFVAVVMTIGLVWFAHRPAPPAPEATWGEVEAQAKQGGYQLITTVKLAELYRRERANLLIVDTRQDWEYRSGHIKDAVNFPLEPTRWSEWRAKGKLARLLGPDKDRTIVFY
jgi:hypothetical protein